MDCRSTILINNNWIWLKIRTIGDYNYLKQITWREWFTLSRYDLGVYRRKNGKGYILRIGKSESIWG